MRVSISIRQPLRRLLHSRHRHRASAAIKLRGGGGGIGGVAGVKYLFKFQNMLSIFFNFKFLFTKYS